MDMDKLKQWLDLTKQYQSEGFWKEIFDQDAASAFLSNENTVPQQTVPSHFVKQQSGFPCCDLFEYENKLVIEAELPGVSKENIQIQMKDQSMILTGEMRSLYPEIHYFRKERPNRAFHKVIPLPFRVDIQGIQSILKNGILTVHLPIVSKESGIINISIDEAES